MDAPPSSSSLAQIAESSSTLTPGTNLYPRMILPQKPNTEAADLLGSAQEDLRTLSLRCGVYRLYQQLSEPLQQELTEVLASGVSAGAIERALYRRGIKLGHQTISRHRAGSCSCRRS